MRKRQPNEGPAPQITKMSAAGTTIPFHDWNKGALSCEKISDLVFDWRFYPRKEVDYRVVRGYARALKAGSLFPVVKIGLLNGEKIIVDGVHRVNSRKEVGLETIDCVTLTFGSAAELFGEAVKLNADHGKAFSNEEVLANVKRLKDYKFNVNEIVMLTHVPASEIYRDYAAPITHVKAPCGRNIYCTPREPSGKELVQFKKALMFIRDVARAGCLPDQDGFFRALIEQTREALGKVKFNGN